MSKIDVPHFTMYPNIVLDELMQDMSGAEFKVISVIVRKTFGWHKDRDVISYSQIQSISGLSTNAIKKAIVELKKKDLLVVKRTGRGKGIRTSYELNMSENDTIDLPIISENDIKKSSIVSKNDTTKESIKDKKIKENRAVSPLKKVEKLYFDLFVEEFKDIPNYNYPACTNLIKKYLKDYGLDKIQYLIRIWFYCKVGEWHGYDFIKLQKDWNRLLIIYKNMDLEKVNEEEYEKYAKNMEFLQEQYHKPKDVETYDEWKRENIRQKFNTIKVSP